MSACIRRAFFSGSRALSKPLIVARYTCWGLDGKLNIFFVQLSLSEHPFQKQKKSVWIFEKSTMSATELPTLSAVPILAFKRVIVPEIGAVNMMLVLRLSAVSVAGLICIWRSLASPRSQVGLQ